VEAISKSDAAVIRAVGQLALQNPNNNILGECSAKTSQIAAATNLAESHLRNLLTELVRRGLVEKVGVPAARSPAVAISLATNHAKR